MRASERQLINQAIDGLMSDDDYAFDSAMGILCMLVGRRSALPPRGESVSMLVASTTAPRNMTAEADHG